MSTLLATPRPEPRWFIDNLVRIHVSGDDTDGRYAIVEAVGREGDMPPLHVHNRDDEVFHVLEGRLTVHLPGEHLELGAGDTFRAPHGIPHVYRVASTTARWLVFCTPAGFDRFVLEMSEPAPGEELPPAGRPQDPAALAEAGARHGIELLGPPGTMP
jgi:quercetin dioxygenase-like cupin family protein